ncbi:MAG TPA: DUF374 domain-containing protein [Paracoccaceae bacterium]|nr:DUF374 domain-containing protein [Paracoccaceae bacterium]
MSAPTKTDLTEPMPVATNVGERLLGRIYAAYIWLVFRTTRWEVRGAEELRAAMKDGPVIYLLWHSRTLMAIPLWPQGLTPITVPTAANRDGRISAVTHSRFNGTPFSMNFRRSNKGASRQILRLIRSGASIGITGDGPFGPRRVLQEAPLEWARISGLPVFLHANSVRRQSRLPGWDRMLFPWPFSRGAAVYRRWDADVPRQMDEAQRADLLNRLSDALDAATAEADALVGLPAGD